MHNYQNVKTERTKRKLSQNQIAEILGITKQQYSLYETGKRECPLHHFIALARYYKVTLDYLAGLTDEEKEGA